MKALGLYLKRQEFVVRKVLYKNQNWYALHIPQYVCFKLFLLSVQTSEKFNFVFLYMTDSQKTTKPENLESIKEIIK